MTRLISIILLLICSNISSAKSIIINDVKDLSAVYKYIKSDNPIPGTTLVVLDIDDTLIEAANFIGSDKWYNWQRGREVFDANGKLVKIDDKEKFMCMFGGTLATLFELGTSKPTQDDAAQIVKQLKVFDLMYLTSRTYGFRSATERELNKNGFNIADKHLMKKGLGLEFILDENFPTLKVTYKNGIVMSSGRNKGLVLKSILEKVNKSYKYIYFADDSRKIIDDMAEEWKDDETIVSIFHYTKVDKSISQEEVAQSIKAKMLIDAFLQTAFPDRHNAFLNSQCH